MWTFEFSNGFKTSLKTKTKEETLYNVALFIRYDLVRFPDDDDWDEEEFENNIPDIYIYDDGKLDEVIKGVDLL